MKDRVNLAVGNVIYHSESSLLQFEIQDISMISKGPDYLVVQLTFQRRCLFHLATTYLLTVCLLIAAEITLFIDERHFEATIMVALTAMLVMYTLHQSITATLPKTASLKLIDIWLINGLLVPFLVFMLEIIIELMGHTTEIDATPNRLTSECKNNQLNPNKKDSKYKFTLLKRCCNVVSSCNNGSKDNNTVVKRHSTKGCFSCFKKEIVAKVGKITIVLSSIVFVVCYMIIAIILYCS